MNSYRKFANDIGIVGITNIALGLRMLILIPVLTKTMGESNYGIWSQVNVAVGLLMVFSGLGLPFALTRFLAAKTDKQDITEGFYTIFWVILFSGLAILGVLVALASPIGNTFFDGSDQIVILIGLITLLSVMNSAYLSLFRTVRWVKAYSVFTIIEAYGQIGIMTYLVIVGQNMTIIIASIAITKIVMLIVLFFLIKAQYGIALPRLSYLKEYLCFGVSTMPGNISTWVLGCSDRYVITYFLGTTAVGIYSVSYAIGSLPSMAIEVIAFVLTPTLTKLFDEDKLDEVRVYMSYSLKYIMALAIPFTFGAFLLERPVLVLISNQEIAAGSHFVMPIIALSTLVAGVYTVIGDILYLTKKMKIVGLAWIIAAVFNLGTNIIAVPYLGILGAAITTLFAYVLMMGILAYYSFKEFSFPIDWKFIAKSIFASLIMSVVIWEINRSLSGSYSILITITVGIVVYTAAIYLLRGFGKEEINFFKNLLNKG